mmetsp:Transcript_12170/g.25641  ORF Transcript_12170/g.25641 Transcript_12170/m.25641 type:complete len:212 (-) Transcript_12170:240-875(-)
MEEASCQKEGSLLSMSPSAAPSWWWRRFSFSSGMDRLLAREAGADREGMWGVIANKEEAPAMFSSPFPSSLSSLASSSSSIGSSPTPTPTDGLSPPALALVSFPAVLLAVTFAVLGAAVQTRARYKARNHSASSLCSLLFELSFSPSLSLSLSSSLLLFELFSMTDDEFEEDMAMAIKTDSTTLVGDSTEVSNSPSRAKTHQGSIRRARFQ